MPEPPKLYHCPGCGKPDADHGADPKACNTVLRVKVIELEEELRHAAKENAALRRELGRKNPKGWDPLAAWEEQAQLARALRWD